MGEGEGNRQRKDKEKKTLLRDMQREALQLIVPAEFNEAVR